MDQYYHVVISHRKTKEVMIVLKCDTKHSPLDVLDKYAEWSGVDSKDLLYKIVRCGDYNDVLANKDFV